MPEEAGESTAIASDSDSTAESGENKFVPDKWIMAKHVVIRMHNKPRTALFTPNEDPLDP